MESLNKSHHKTNTPALVALSLFTLIVVGVFFKLKDNDGYGPYRQIHRAEYNRQPSAPIKTSDLEADVSAALQFDNSDDLNTIDNQF